MRTRMVFFILLLPFASPAQWIPIRTVPVIAGNQSEFLPSIARGMGNCSIACDDPLGDPFINPAKGSRQQGVLLFLSPSRNSWGNENGRSVNAGRGSSSYPGTSLNSFPLGVLFNAGDYFSGVSFAYQGYKSERSTSDMRSYRSDLGNNTYAFGMFGATLLDAKLSVGASFAWAGLNAIDGVNLLYPGAQDLTQEGDSWEAKLGILGELPDGDRLEFIAGRGVAKSTHQVSYSSFTTSHMTLTEINEDETRQWLCHAAYVRPLSERWTIGAALSANWKDHPKIPNYELANIPRDPGTSSAYNAGIGATTTNGRSLWTFEYIFEPIDSYTWAEAGEQQTIPQIQRLAPTFKTVENYFDFANHIARVGHRAKTQAEWLDYRFGAQLHFYSYELNQHDNLAHRSRKAEYGWIETTLSGGVTVHFGNLRLLYTLQLILGNGMVGTVSQSFLTVNGADLVRANDFLPAPSGRLVVDSITLVTQQLAFVYSIQ